MKKITQLFIITFIPLLFNSCRAIEGIFKAGMGFGIFLVVVVIVIIVVIVMRSGKK